MSATLPTNASQCESREKGTLNTIYSVRNDSERYAGWFDVCNDG